MKRLIAIFAAITVSAGDVTVTAYCPCRKCCGPGATGLAANGRPPIEGVTVAASRRIPLGTTIRLTVYGAFTNRPFIVTDRLAKRFDDRVDIFFDRHGTAQLFGKQSGTYTIR